VEKGIHVVIPVLGLHRDPKYFPDPEKFKPERFSDEAKLHRPNYVYLPFGEGQRICIGMSLNVQICLVSCVRMM
jgi:cytochrome P450 family 6